MATETGNQDKVDPPVETAWKLVPPRKRPVLSLITPRPLGIPSDVKGPLPALKELFTKEELKSSHRPSNKKPGLPKLDIPPNYELTCWGITLKQYIIEEKPYVMMVPPENETAVRFSRRTVDGRALDYHLEVVQQPVKARACGSGPRSCSDRRPVDPPPVVRLVIHNGTQDVTNTHDAGFLLFASLEFARPIRANHMHDPSHKFPVLTGVCVAGAAYLVKPTNAAYFIFPDLSVRHEGYYRLKFHLFEQIKHECDADAESPMVRTNNSSSYQNPVGPVSHENMHNRAYVYSAPFQVFSAKKFPGLSQSTQLSQELQAQGCRVRIRRDVRQRRHSKKVPEEEDSVSNRATPIRALSHERNSSMDSLNRQPLPPDYNRRPSYGSYESSYPRPRHSSYSDSSIASPLPTTSHSVYSRAPITSSPMSTTFPPVSYNHQQNQPQQASAPMAPPPLVRRSSDQNARNPAIQLPSITQLEAMLPPPAPPAPPASGSYTTESVLGNKRQKPSSSFDQPATAPLKDHARPERRNTLADMLNPAPEPKRSLPSLISSMGAIEADDDNAPSEDESDIDDIFANGLGARGYKRANGTVMPVVRSA